MSGLTLPVRARWVDGKKKGGRILLDPSSFPLRFKKEESHHRFYVCQRTSEEKILAAVENQSVSPCSVYEDIERVVLSNSSLGQARLAYIPKQQTVSRNLQVKRKIMLDYPALKKDLEEIVVPEAMNVTYDSRVRPVVRFC